jgi:hypothetical protein
MTFGMVIDPKHMNKFCTSHDDGMLRRRYIDLINGSIVKICIDAIYAEKCIAK